MKRGTNKTLEKGDNFNGFYNKRMEKAERFFAANNG